MRQISPKTCHVRVYNVFLSRMRKHIALLTMSVAAFAYAQSSPNEVDSVNTLDTVVVTETLPKTAASSAPLRLADQHTILRSGISDVSDALRRMPGVNLRDYGGAGGLKTVSVRGFGASHTGVFYDGVPLSDVQSGQIDLARYSIDNLGVVTMLVGDNQDIFLPARAAASAAAVDINSAPLPTHAQLTAKMRVGSFGFLNPFLRVGTPIGKNSAVNIVADYVHADNDYPFTLVNGALVTTETRQNSRMNSGHAEIDFAHDFSDATSLRSKIYYYESSRQLPGPVIYYNNVSNEHLKEQNAMAQTRLQTRLSSQLTLRAILKYNFASTKYHDIDGQYPGGELIQNYWQREYYGAAALLYVPSDRWLCDYSADYFYNNLNSSLSNDRRPYRQSVLQSFAVKHISPSRLTVTARILLSMYNNGAHSGDAAEDVSKLSPSLSLLYQPLRHELLYLRASYKNIFRMPTFNEAYFDHYGSTDVMPESTDQLNLGATYTLRPKGSLSYATFTLDGYVNNIRDMIVAVPYNMFIWRVVNLGKVRTYGIDATAELTVSPRKTHDITLSLNYSYQRAMPLTDPASSEWKKQVAYIPRHSGSAAVSYENPWLNLSLSATGVSDRYTTNNNLPATRIAGYVECGASAWRSFALKAYTIDVRAEVLNLLNKQYCVVARYPMPGRQYKLSIAINF